MCIPSPNISLQLPHKSAGVLILADKNFQEPKPSVDILLWSKSWMATPPPPNTHTHTPSSEKLKVKSSYISSIHLLGASTPVLHKPSLYLYGIYSQCDQFVKVVDVTRICPIHTKMETDGFFLSERVCVFSCCQAWIAFL